VGKFFRRCIGIYPWLIICFLFNPSRPAYPASNHLKLTPDAVSVGMFFKGANLTVSGEIPEGCNAIIEISGKYTGKEPGRSRHWWDIRRNRNESEITGVPYLYYLMSSDAGLVSHVKGARPWGYEQLRKTASMKAPHTNNEKVKLFNEFVRHKEDKGLYGMFPAALQLYCIKQNQCMAEGKFHFPAQVPAGTYDVCLFVIKNGTPVECRCKPFAVSITGLPAFIRFMTDANPVFYGILSILAASIIGIIFALLFKLKMKVKDRDKSDG